MRFSLKHEADRVVRLGLGAHAQLLCVFPINMARIANQIVSVCAWLINFSPSIVPPPTDKKIDADSTSSDEDSELDV